MQRKNVDGSLQAASTLRLRHFKKQNCVRAANRRWHRKRKKNPPIFVHRTFTRAHQRASFARRTSENAQAIDDVAPPCAGKTRWFWRSVAARKRSLCSLRRRALRGYAQRHPDTAPLGGLLDRLRHFADEARDVLIGFCFGSAHQQRIAKLGVFLDQRHAGDDALVCQLLD